jgi:riboflavin biosynthesis pyrimidine reductase
MDRPKVVVVDGASLDGRLAISPDRPLLYGDQRWQSIEVPSSFNVTDYLKSVYKPGAILEGSNSFVPEGGTVEPLPPVESDPTAFYADYLPEKIIHRSGHQGWFTVVDGRGRIRWAYKEYPDPQWVGWYALVLVGYHTPPEYLAYLRREEIPYLVAGNGQVDLYSALNKMYSLLGVECVLSTAGGRLNGALLRLGLVDEVNVEFLPGIVGGYEAPSLFDSPELGPEEMPVRLKLLSAQVQSEGRVWLRYEVIRSGD